MNTATQLHCGQDLAALPLEHVVELLVADHVRWREHVFPAIDSLLTQLLRLPAGRQPFALEIQRRFWRLRAEMEGHMRREENVLFPAILRAASRARNGQPAERNSFGSLKNPVSMARHEHSAEVELFAAMRYAGSDYALPAEGPDCLRELFSRLHEFEKSVRFHTRLEDEVLFQRAVKLDAV